MSDSRFRLALTLRWQAGPSEETLEKARPALEAGVLSEETTWATASLLEAGGWLCLGAQIGLFPDDATRSALHMLFGRRRRLWRCLPDEERYRLLGNDWAEALAVGNVEQAMAIHSVRQPSGASSQLLPAFQSAELHAQRWNSTRAVSSLLRRLSLADEEAWRAFAAAHDSPAEVIRSGEREQWGKLAGAVHPFDGLILLLNQLQCLSSWAESTVARGERRGHRELDSEGARGEAARDLVRAVGKLQRWKLDLGDDRLRQRLWDMIGEVESLVPALLEVARAKVEDAWPQGLAAAFEEALSGWDQISGEASGEYSDPSDGGSGGGERQVELQKELVEARGELLGA